MVDISVQKIKKAFEEGVDILDDITFDVSEGERVGLLGKNGAGKTTLMRIIAGELSEDEGEIVVPSSKVLGMVSQIPEFPDHFTADDVLKTAFSRLYSIKSEMEQLESVMSSSASDDVLEKYDKLAHEYERLGGYTSEIELNRVANGLQIPQGQRTQLFSTLSGGEKTRINLARLILEDTDILLLDEPTNHLDLNATIWLEEFLIKFKGTVLIISHDRYFLDRVINRAIEISNGKAEFYTGNYSYYVHEKKRRYNEQMARYEREQAEAKRLNYTADRLQGWGIGKSSLMKKSFAMRTRAERVLQTDRPDKDKTMRASFSKREFRGDEALLIKGLTKSYNDKKLIDIDELLVQGGERIVLIGDNGTGKTTLIKMIMGEVKPDSGMIRLGPSVKPAYLPQIIEFADENRSVMDTLIYEQNESPQTARNRLGAYLFSGEDVFKYVGDLSGGEKSRLRLCMLMKNEVNMLILDEPTNHLDLASREWIESAVEQYDETLLFISHDRYFINRFATRIWALEDGALTDFRGTYEQYMAMRAERKDSANAPVANDSSGTASGKNTSSGNGKGKQKQTGQSQSKKKIKPSELQKELRRLEREIEKLEVELYDIEVQKSEFSSDYEKLLEFDDLEKNAQQKLDDLLEQWEELASENV